MAIANIEYLYEKTLPTEESFTVLGDECQYVTGMGDLKITPQKNTFHSNGVSTLDLILIKKHILGIIPLNSPYKLFAADINNSGTITTLDLIELQQLILRIIPRFQHNTSWRFIDGNFTFPNPENPWETPIPEFFYSNNLSIMPFLEPFIGVKIGDVSCSANPNDSLIQPGANSRFAFNLDIINQHFERGETVQVDFHIEDINPYAGFQFALDVNPNYLKFEQFEKGVLKDLDQTNFNWQDIANGKIRSCWIDQNAEHTEREKGPLFSLRFQALQAGSLQGLLKLNPTALRSEAYTNDLSLAELNLRFTEMKASPSDLNVQAMPNPFKETTTIRFELVSSDQLVFTLTDVQGKVIKRIEKQVDKGWNELKLAADWFPTSGLYFYQLETSKQNYSQRLLKL